MPSANGEVLDAIREVKMAETAMLCQHMLELTSQWFAVLDGAQFDDLPASLFDGDFVYRPLYLDRGDGNRDRVLTGPQLVWLNETGHSDRPRSKPEVLDRLFDLIGGRAAAVFWECPDGGEALYRHLRSINMVMIPRKEAERTGAETEASGTLKPQGPVGNMEATAALFEKTHEMVLFRHADANVMAQILSALKPAQLSRLFGPATQILFAPEEEWGGRIKRGLRADSLPVSPTGPLRLEAETIQAIEDRRKAAVNRSVVAYLRKVAPPGASQFDDAALSQQVERSITSARGFGVRSEAAYCRWAYLHIVTGGEVGRDKQIRTFMTSDKLRSSPDQRVRQLMRATIERLEAMT